MKLQGNGVDDTLMIFVNCTACQMLLCRSYQEEQRGLVSGENWGCCILWFGMWRELG